MKRRAVDIQIVKGGQLVGRAHLDGSRKVNRIGTAATAEVQIADPGAGRLHAAIEVSGGGVTLIDMGSPNGTQLNGKPISKAQLSTGDQITIGSTTLTITLADPGSAEARPMTPAPSAAVVLPSAAAMLAAEVRADEGMGPGVTLPDIGPPPGAMHPTTGSPRPTTLPPRVPGHPGPAPGTPGLQRAQAIGMSPDKLLARSAGGSDVDAADSELSASGSRFSIGGSKLDIGGSGVDSSEPHDEALPDHDPMVTRLREKHRRNQRLAFVGLPIGTAVVVVFGYFGLQQRPPEIVIPERATAGHEYSLEEIIELARFEIDEPRDPERYDYYRVNGTTTLRFIASKDYGDLSLAFILLAANSKVKAETEEITAHQEVRIPKFIVHIVGDGDTLESIAEKRLHDASRSQAIRAANAAALGDPPQLKPGLELRLPLIVVGE